MAEEHAQRRLAAILAADVVAYSRLMEQDEAATLAALKARRREVLGPLVARYAGRVFKVAGDGVLVEFGSAVNAVQCAIDLQQGMNLANDGLPEDSRIVLRVGINLGDVMVEGGDLYGDGVNIATRLEAMAEPGGVLLSGTAHDHVRNKIKAGFVDLGFQTLKNIAEPVRVYRIGDIPRIAPQAPPLKPPGDKASIAVLPFVNMSDDPGQEYFADGLTEDIITALSHFSGLMVIARTSSFVYKGQNADTKRVARELGVGYVMEGSVRRAGDRVRVTAQLIDGASGHHVWAERFDRPAGDIFDIQDEITRSVAASTEIQIHISERQRIEAGALDPGTGHARATAEPRAGELVMRAWGRIYDFTPDAFAEAAELAEQAILLEPANRRAHIIRARVHMNRMWFGVIPHSDENIARAVQLAETGSRLAPRDEWAHYCMAYACELTGRIRQAVAECRRAIELNPNFSNGYAELGRCLAVLGESREAMEASRTALRLNPRDPTNWERHATLAIAHFTEENYEASLVEARRVTETVPDLPEGQIMLVAAAAACGEIAEARHVAASCLERWPDLRCGNITPIYFIGFLHERPRDRLMAMLRQAGFPA